MIYNLAMKLVSLGLAFLLELVAFIFFSAIPFTFDIERYIQIAFTGIIFVVIILFWSRFMSPKANEKFGVTGYYLSKFFIYAASAYSIFELAHVSIFWVFVAAVLLDELLLLRHNMNSLSRVS